MRAKLELGKLSVERLPPDPFSAMKFVMAWLLACWLGRLADFLMACFWLVCWLASLRLVAFWFARFLLCLLCWHLFGLLACWLAEGAQCFAGLLVCAAVLACQFMMAGRLACAEYPMMQHYRHSGNRRNISFKII